MALKELVAEVDALAEHFAKLYEGRTLEQTITAIGKYCEKREGHSINIHRARSKKAAGSKKYEEVVVSIAQLRQQVRQYFYGSWVLLNGQNEQKGIARDLAEKYVQQRLNIAHDEVDARTEILHFQEVAYLCKEGGNHPHTISPILAKAFVDPARPVSNYAIVHSNLVYSHWDEFINKDGVPVCRSCGPVGLHEKKTGDYLVVLPRVNKEEKLHRLINETIAQFRDKPGITYERVKGALIAAAKRVGSATDDRSLFDILSRTRWTSVTIDDLLTKTEYIQVSDKRKIAQFREEKRRIYPNGRRSVYVAESAPDNGSLEYRDALRDAVHIQIPEPLLILKYRVKLDTLGEKILRQKFASKKTSDSTEIMDLLGLRAITQTEEECYAFLELIKSMGIPYLEPFTADGNPHLYHDYIRNPKVRAGDTETRGYQSIHSKFMLKVQPGTTHLKKLELRVPELYRGVYEGELQIRSNAMDTVAETHPLYRHDTYKEGTREILKQVRELGKELGVSTEFFQRKMLIFMYILNPKILCPEMYYSH